VFGGLHICKPHSSETAKCGNPECPINKGELKLHRDLGGAIGVLFRSIPRLVLFSG